jgi:hypothetical protein
MIKRSLRAFLITLFACCLVVGCHKTNTVTGNGVKQTDTRNLSSFQNIELAGNFQVVIVGQMAQRVALTTDSNLVSHYTTEVKNNTLYIGIEPNYDLKPQQTPVVEIAVPTLQSIVINGAAKINASQLVGDRLTITINGTGSGNISAQTKSEDIKIAGAGNLTLTGETNQASLKVDGSGKINAQGLSAKDAQVKVTGAGYVSVTTRENLDVNVSGTGLVEYYGSPSKITQTISGVGKVIGISSNDAKSTS